MENNYNSKAIICDQNTNKTVLKQLKYNKNNYIDFSVKSSCK